MIEQSSEQLSQECAAVAADLAEAKATLSRVNQFAETFGGRGGFEQCRTPEEFHGRALARAKTLRAETLREDHRREVEMLEKRLAHLADELVTVLKPDALRAVTFDDAQRDGPEATATRR